MYEWWKALHVIAVMAWMAGLFYLPRLFVYHVAEPIGSQTSETFWIMERRLMGAIMRPAALVTLLSGGLVWFAAGYSLGDFWLLMKLLGVVGMVAFHGLLESHLLAFSRDERPRTGRYFRIINEVPTILLIWIVIWVVVKPFN
jgi:protoporphyrinogen IX oxidase